ncbi:PIN domain-containing protein, partial [Candidatus Woesearchaeota archaeon]|nr:PIN domain-containing protein [Candidatus Woesearchaeota archaeon]
MVAKKEIKSVERLVPDTSVIIEGILSRKIEAKELLPQQVIIHEAVLAELEHQANQNKSIGFLGIDEIDKLKQLSGKLGFELAFGGKRPSAYEISQARLGEMDSLIRELAFESDATLLTTDKVQARIGMAKGISVILLEIDVIKKKLTLEGFFDLTTMSVHLRENVPPFAKKGVPGKWDFVKVREKPLTRDEVRGISDEIIEEAGVRKDCFIEIERPGSTIVQLENYRIVITRPPF